LGTPLRLLLIEDSENDAQLLIHELRRGGYDVVHERVDTASALEAALDRQTWDLAIGDYSMPQFSGMAALRIIQDRGLDVPFISVSGTITEEMAVAAMRAGAKDYVTKGQLKRLVPATDRELGEAKARAALRDKEASYATLVEYAPIGIYRSNPVGQFLSVNSELVRILGYDSAADVLALDMGRDVYADVAERQRLIDRDTYTDHQYDDVEATWKRKDGHLLNVQLSVRAMRNAAGQIDYYETFVRDITEQRLLHQQLAQSQKLEAIGRLAGGVAHDFNNVLTAVFGYVDLLREELPANSAAQRDLDEVRKASERAASLTKQLLAFSRQQILEPVVLELNELVEDFEKMLRRVIGEDVAMRLALGKHVGNVRADPGQLQQVLMNLVVNARDAMPTGGTLILETTNADLTEQYAELHQPVVPGPYIMLAVSDTGTGMTPETKARIFEPFFTTKEKHKGTGLGLSTVYGIVKQSGGYIWVYSEVGRGTTFKVYLPRVDAPADELHRPREPGTVAGTETILLAEDDAVLRPLAKGLLEKLGYTVLDAENAAGALEAAEKHAGPIHLLVADVVMPGASGRELARELEKIRPTTKVLYVSGYTDDAIIHHGMLEPGLNFLQKPFTPAVLGRRVRDVLDAP